MRMGRAAGEGDEAEVAMGPLIDAVFLLLIFFLVATISKEDDRDVDLTPPRSVSDVRMLPAKDQVVIGIDAAGELYWQGRPTTLGGLHDELRTIAEANPDQRIRLDTDEATPYGRVVEVLDLLQFRRLGNVGIRTYDDRYNRR